MTIIRCVTAARELVSQYIAAHGVEQKPGIAALLEFCKQAGLAYAIATATSQELARERLALAGLDGMFPDIVGGDQVKHGKPDPDIYVIAAKALGLPPEECVAIEDSPNGIAAGLDAGCNVILVPDLTPPEPGDRDRPIWYCRKSGRSDRTLETCLSSERRR